MDEFSEKARRRKSHAVGVPIVLADGDEWHLAPGGLTRALDQLRDDLFDDSQVAGEVRTSDLRWAAYALLAANYRLDVDELESLFDGVSVATIGDAVTDALFGPDRPRRRYTGWARASLWSNGIDPDKVPPADVPGLLSYLVEAGRAIPLAEYCDSVKAAVTIGAEREIARQQAMERTHQRDLAPAPIADGEGP